MRRFIITGAPGAGKTAIIRQLERDGFSVVEEAATDLIAAQQAKGVAEPWTDPSFIDAVARLQKARLQQERETRSSHVPGQLQFHDRSVICTAALAVYLGYPFSPFLESELDRIKKEAIFEQQVFFIQNLGFIEPTDARRISFEESLRFEKIHEDVYRDHGFSLITIGPGRVTERGDAIKAAIAQTQHPSPPPFSYTLKT
jgi:predicted ATPase